MRERESWVIEGWSIHLIEDKDKLIVFNPRYKKYRTGENTKGPKTEPNTEPNCGLLTNIFCPKR